MTTINWTSGAGNKIEISFAAMYELDLQGRRKTFGRKEVVVMATVDGSTIQHMGLQHTDHAVAVAKVGIIGLIAAKLISILLPAPDVQLIVVIVSFP